MPAPRGTKTVWEAKVDVDLVLHRRSDIAIYVVYLRHPVPSSHSRHRTACIDYPEDCRKTAPFLFHSIFSLLKQWPNTYAPNGHSLVLTSIPAHTLLYHARPDEDPLKKPTFFALDALASLTRVKETRS